jgi:putative hemolysin
MTPFVIILLCLLAQAFFAGIETGIISIHRMRLRHFVRQGSPHANLLQAYVQNFDRLLGTTLVGTNLCLVLASVTAASISHARFGSVGEAVSSLILSSIILIFCEYIPKAWFHARPLERSQRFAGLLRVAEVLFFPLSFTIIAITRLITGGSRRTFERPDPFITREDLKLLAREGERDGVLSSRERAMIQRVIELPAKTARDIMVPRERMICATTDMNTADVLDLARKSRVTRLPLINRKEDRFVGVLNVFHLLSSGPQAKDRPLMDFVRPPLSIPHSMPADDILPRMRGARHPLCLVTDDTGTTLGLISTEDVLRTIVGTLQK